MERLNFLILLLLISYSGFSQTDVPNYLYCFELEKPQQQTWNEIEISWLETVFYPYVKKSKIKLADCQKCGSLYINIEFSIDANGIMTIDSSIAKSCGKPMIKKLENYLMNCFISKTFLKNLRNLKIQHRLGVLYKY